MENKTLFDAVEGELRNARTAINTAGAYMDMLKNATNSMDADVIVKTESEKYEKLIAVNKRLREHSNLL
jgi:hypothetical protein